MFQTTNTVSANMTSPPATYPRRPRFFANRFCRLMTKVCLANHIGPEACYLLMTVAMTEDAKSYRGAVTYWNEQLVPLVGLSNVKALDRVRSRAIEAGWLHYTPGGKGRPGAYWVVIPADFYGMDDAPTDENATEYLPALLDKNDQQSGREVGSKAGEKREGSGREAGEKREGSGQPSSLSFPLPVLREESPTVSGASPPPDVNVKPKPEPKPRKESTGHAQAIAGWCSRWESVYGVKAVFNGGKDGTAVKWMLSQVSDVAGLFAVFDRYLADRSEFVTEARHTLGVLRSQFSRWMVDALPAKAREPTANGKTHRSSLPYDDYTNYIPKPSTPDER